MVPPYFGTFTKDLLAVLSSGTFLAVCIRHDLQRTCWSFSTDSTTGSKCDTVRVCFRPSETHSWDTQFWSHRHASSLRRHLPTRCNLNEFISHSVACLNVQPTFPYVNLLLEPTHEPWSLTEMPDTDPDCVTAPSGFRDVRHMHTVRHSLQVIRVVVYPIYHQSQNFTFPARMINYLLQLKSLVHISCCCHTPGCGVIGLCRVDVIFFFTSAPDFWWTT